GPQVARGGASSSVRVARPDDGESDGGLVRELLLGLQLVLDVLLLLGRQVVRIGATPATEADRHGEQAQGSISHEARGEGAEPESNVRHVRTLEIKVSVLRSGRCRSP